VRRGTGATALAAIRAKIADGPIFLPRPGSPSRWPCATATRRQDRRRRPRLRRRGRSRPEHAVLQASGCIPATGFHRLRPRRPPHDAAGLVLRQVVHAVRTEPSQRDVAGLLAVISAGFSTRGSVATQRRRWRSTRLLQHASATSTANATACCIAAAAPGHPKGPVSCITAVHGPISWRRMGDSNPRGLAPNTLSNCVFRCSWQSTDVYLRRSAPVGRQRPTAIDGHEHEGTATETATAEEAAAVRPLRRGRHPAGGRCPAPPRSGAPRQCGT